MILKTQCARDCPDACFLDAQVEDGRLVRVSGGADNPVTNGFTCPRGAGDPARVYSKERVLYPRLRVGPKPGRELAQTTWGEAISTVSGRLRDVLREEGADRVLLLNYYGNNGLVSSAYGLRLWNVLSAARTNETICARSGHAALKLHYGLSYGVEPEELPARRVLTFWGMNARVSSIHTWAKAEEAQRRGAKIVSVDPRRSETSEAADLWISPRPGTDVALAYGVANTLIGSSRVDWGFVEEWTTGYSKYRAEAAKWTPERVEEVTGVPRGTVEEYADLLWKEKPGAILMGIGFQKSGQGAEAVRAVGLLPALLGEHRGFYYTNSRGRFVDWVHLTGEAANGGRVVSMVALGKLLEAGEFSFVYVVNANPAMTLPDSHAVRRGLARGGVYVAVHDTHLTETCRYADSVLPATTFYEKDDVVVSDSHPYTRLSRRVVEPLGESRSEARVMADLASALGIDHSLLREAPEAALEKALDGALEGSFAKLRSGSDLKVKCRERRQYQTPSGKIEFYSTAPEGASPLPAQLPAAGPGLVLLNSSQPKWTHSQFRDVYGEIPLVVWVNPADAEALGVENGSRVRLSNGFGGLVLAAEVTDRVPRGVLWSPRPLEDLEGNPQNGLTSGEPQALGGGPRYNSARVTLSPA